MVASNKPTMKKILATPDGQDVFDEMTERQVNSFMVSYANYTKNKYQHHGGLFQKPFKRIRIDSDVHLQVAIIYTHANPVKHKIFKDYLFYPLHFHVLLHTYNFFLPVKGGLSDG